MPKTRTASKAAPFLSIDAFGKPDEIEEHYEKWLQYEGANSDNARSWQQAFDVALGQPWPRCGRSTTGFCRSNRCLAARSTSARRPVRNYSEVSSFSISGGSLNSMLRRRFRILGARKLVPRK